MKIALDPLVHADVPLEQLPHKAAEMGFEYLDLCSRDEFFPEYFPPRANAERVRALKKGSTTAPRRASWSAWRN